jgi:hypothetical protein
MNTVYVVFYDCPFCFEMHSVNFVDKQTCHDAVLNRCDLVKKGPKFYGTVVAVWDLGQEGLINIHKEHNTEQ